MATMASSVPAVPTLREQPDRVRPGFNVSATSESRETFVVPLVQYGPVTGSLLTAPPPPRVSPPPWFPPFFVLAIVWGSSFLFIKVAVAEMHPLYLTLGRCAAGA